MPSKQRCQSCIVLYTFSAYLLAGVEMQLQISVIDLEQCRYRQSALFDTRGEGCKFGLNFEFHNSSRRPHASMDFSPRQKHCCMIPATQAVAQKISPALGCSANQKPVRTVRNHGASMAISQGKKSLGGN